MEGDDRARTGILLHLTQNLTAIELGVIVARDKVPHNDMVALAKDTILTQTHESVRRTKEVGAEVTVCLVDIGHIMIGMFCHPLEVVVGVVAYAVATLDDHLELVGMLTHIVTHHEESGLDAVLVQHIKHPRGDLWDRAIIKGEVYGTLR